MSFRLSFREDCFFMRLSTVAFFLTFKRHLNGKSIFIFSSLSNKNLTFRTTTTHLLKHSGKLEGC